MKKTGRNDPCPCGSGKKFKKCCENKMIGKKFMATKMDSQKTEDMKRNSSSISSFFKHKVTQITPTRKTKEIKATVKKKDEEIPKEERVDLVEEALKERLGEDYLKEKEKKDKNKPTDTEQKKD